MILKAVREMRIYEKEKKYYYCGCLCACAAGIAAGIYGMTRKKGSPEAVNDSTAQTVQEQTTQEVKNPHAGQAQSVISGKWESRNWHSRRLWQ